MADDYSDLGAQPIEDYSDLGATPIATENQDPSQNLLGGIGPYGLNLQNTKGPQALLAGIPKGIGTIGYNTNLLGVEGLNKLGANLPLPTNPFNYASGSYLSNLEQQYPGQSGLGQILGETVPFLATGGASIPGQLLSGAVQGAVTNPQNVGTSALLGAGLGLGGGLIQKGVGAVGNAISNSFNNEVNAAFDRLGIQNAPLGERMESPNLYKFSQNVLTKAPFSGAAQNYMDINNQLDNSVSQAINSMKPSTPISEIPENIQDKLKSVFTDVTKQKNANYDAVDQRATQIGASVMPNNYGQKAQSILDDANQLSQTSPELALSSQTKNLLQNIVDSSTQPKTFKETSLVLGKLNNLSNDLYNSNNFGSSYESGLISSLKSPLLQDMNEGATNAGDPQLMNLHSQAQQYYANDYAPFLDKNINQYLSGSSKADNPDLLIQSFLKTGANNQPTLLNKLMTKLPANQKGDVGYYFLNRSLPRDNLGNPIMNRNTIVGLNQSLQNYDPQIRNQLIPPQVQQTLQDVGTVQKVMTNPMANPPTGQRIADLLGIGTLGGLGLQAARDPEHRNEYLSAMAGITPGGKLAQLALTSPVLRQFLQQGALTSASKLAPLISAISNNLLNANRSSS